MIERAEIAPGYSVSRLIHGGWQFSAGHRLAGAPSDDPVEVLMASAELGVTTFDCADIYAGVEELYGHFIERWRTTSTARPVEIHTKFVPDYDDLPRVDRAYVSRIVERSLTRLGVERLDLVQFYWWRDDVPGMEDAAGWLAELRDEGKIRHVAGTNLDVERIRAIEAAGVELVANQVQYSLLDRRAEGGLADQARASGTRLLAFGTLAGGFLTDRWLGRPDPTESETRSMTKYRLIIEEFGGWPAYQSLLATLDRIARNHEVEMAAVATRFVLDRPGVAGAIVGATRLGQMERNVRAFSVDLTEDDRRRIQTQLDAAPGPSGPIFGLERDRDGPHGRIMKYDLNREA